MAHVESGVVEETAEEAALHFTTSSTSASRTVQFSGPKIKRIKGAASHFPMLAVVGIAVAPVGLDHVGSLLSYHDHRSIGVPGHDCGHNGGVNNSQSWYPVHLQGTLSRI